LAKARVYRAQAKDLGTQDEPLEKEVPVAVTKQKSKSPSMEPAVKKARKERAASVDSDMPSEAEPPVVSKEKVRNIGWWIHIDADVLVSEAQTNGTVNSRLG
jgi:hypothetical protein